MYGGVDKYGGAVVGGTVAGGVEGETLEECMQNSSVGETLVLKQLTEQGEEVAILLQAALEPRYGGLTWQPVEDTGTALSTAVAMSQMTSMLHDQDRNNKYEEAIRRTIEKFQQTEGRDPVVLDIGTGTGLLAMMAARSGAEKVYGCELFPAMAEIASHVTKENFKDGRITIIPKKSTDMTVGEGGDIPQRADLLVTEIFDSVLLGEGVLPSLRHAFESLLAPGAKVVPQRARIFAQVIQCEELLNFYRSPGSLTTNLQFYRSDTAKSCDGGVVPLPLHCQALSSLRPLSDSFEVFSFSFDSSAIDAEPETREIQVSIQTSGEVHGLLLWWELYLDETVTYSTAPGKENWQDHWTQVVYPVGSQAFAVQARDVVRVGASRSDLNVWFQLKPEAPQELAEQEIGRSRKMMKLASHEPAQCICGIHALLNHERIQLLNDKDYITAYARAIKRAIDESPAPEDVACLDIGDGGLCALLALSVGCKTVTSIEEKFFSGVLLNQIAKYNGLADYLSTLHSGTQDLEVADLQDEKKISLLVGEPYYYQMQSFQTWQAANYWIMRSAVQELLAPEVRVIPCQARVMAVALELPDLSKSFGAVGAVNGFDHHFLDAVQANAVDKEYPFPVWMYANRLLSTPFEILSFDYTGAAQTVEREGSVSFTEDGTLHAVAIWVDYQLDEVNFVSLGWREGRWPLHSKQSLRIFRAYENICASGSTRLVFKASFQVDTAALHFAFSLNR